MRLASIARQASRVAKDETKEIVRVAGIKALLGLIGALFAGIAIIFGLIGLYLLLRAELGEVLAAFCMAGGCLLLAILFLLLSLRIRAKTNMASGAQRLEAIANEATKELRSASPYLVLGAFVLGFLQSKK